MVMWIPSLLGLVENASATAPIDCGALHNDAMVYILANATLPLTEAEATAQIDNYVAIHGLDAYDPQVFHAAAFGDVDPAAPAPDPLFANQLQLYHDAVQARKGTPTSLASELPALLAELDALDLQSEQVLTGSSLELVLCASSVIGASATFWSDVATTMTWNQDEAGGEGEDTDVTIFEADADGAEAGAWAGYWEGGMMTGSDAGAAIGSLLGEALGAAGASAGEAASEVGEALEGLLTIILGEDGGGADPTDGDPGGDGDGEGDNEGDADVGDGSDAP